MKEGSIIAGFNKLALQVATVSKMVVGMDKEMAELRAYLTAETIRRQVLEEMLFERSKLLGGLIKETFDKKYDEKIAEFNKEVAKQMDDQKKATEEAAKVSEEPKKKLYGPDGAPV